MRQIFQSKRLLLFLATVGFVLFGFAGMFNRLFGVFQDDLEDMSHGWLVPVFSLYVLWTERKELKESVGAPSWGGLLACIPCALVALLGTRGLQLRFEQVGFIGLCIALPWAFFGRRTAQCCIFPALFLLFTIPLATFLDAITIHLRLLASGTAFAVLKGFGVAAVQHGTAIVSEGSHAFSIDVAEPCSGLRSLFALMALTAAYAWYTQPTWTRRGILFAFSIPLAVLGNVTRILSICLVAAWGDPKVATGFYHDYSGYIVFMVAIACMVGIGEIITKASERGKVTGETLKEADEPAVGAASTSRLSPFTFHLSLFTLLLLAPIFVFQAMTPMSTLAEAPVVAWPAELKGYEADDLRFCQEEKCTGAFLASRLEKGQEVCPVCGGRLDVVALSENTVLPEDTKIVKKVYTSMLGQQFVVSAVIGGKSKSSIHRPELCLPSQGFQMSDPRNLTVAGRPFHALRLDGPNRPPSLLAYTFFNQNGMRTASHMRRIFIDTWDRSVHNRIDRWVMITVNASAPQGFALERPTDRRALEMFLGKLVEALP